MIGKVEGGYGEIEDYVAEVENLFLNSSYSDVEQVDNEIRCGPAVDDATTKTLLVTGRDTKNWYREEKFKSLCAMSKKCGKWQDVRGKRAALQAERGEL